MSLISFSQLQDGVTGVNAAATNTPLTTIYNDYNGNVTDANIASNAAIAFSKVAGGSSTALVAWATWTPTFGSITLNNGTLNYAKYIQIGKTVHFRAKLTFGSTTAAGSNYTMSLPVAMHADYVAPDPLIGMTAFFNSTEYIGTIEALTSTTVSLRALHTDGTRGNVESAGSADPFTPTTGNIVYVTGTYEAA